MAFVICDKHGGHVAPLVCPHIQEDVSNRRKISTVIRLDAESLSEPAWSVHVCTRCAEDHGFSESQLVPGDGGLDMLLEFEQVPVCKLCFDELRGQFAAE